MYLRWYFIWGLDSDFRIPFSWGQNSDLIQELINSWKNVLSVLCSIRYLPENLEIEQLIFHQLIIYASNVNSKNLAIFLSFIKFYNTSSTIIVDMARPISTFLFWHPGGPKRRKMNLVGKGTSVRSPKDLASVNRTKAVIWYFRQSNSPTSILAASAPSGIFFMNCWFNCNQMLYGWNITDKA